MKKPGTKRCTRSNWQVRRWAAVWAGNHGVEAIPLLPTLFEMIEEKLNDSRDWFPWGEYVFVGRILRELNTAIEAGNESDELRTTFANGYKKILSYMDVATGASASLLIYNLVLIGPRAKDASQLKLDVVSRIDDDRIRHRAYQYAYFVDRRLLEQLPWITFATVPAVQYFMCKLNGTVPPPACPVGSKVGLAKRRAA